MIEELRWQTKWVIITIKWRAGMRQLLNCDCTYLRCCSIFGHEPISTKTCQWPNGSIPSCGFPYSNFKIFHHFPWIDPLCDGGLSTSDWLSSVGHRPSNRYQDLVLYLANVIFLDLLSRKLWLIIKSNRFAGWPSDVDDFSSETQIKNINFFTVKTERRIRTFLLYFEFTMSI